MEIRTLLLQKVTSSHMRINPGRSHQGFTRSIAATLVLVGALVVVQNSVLPLSSASAKCSGNGSPTVVYRFYGEEWPSEYLGYAVTCDGDNYYSGAVYDTYTDGSCVWVNYYDTGYGATQQYSCDSAGNWYSFSDTTGNSDAEMQMCRNQGCDFGNTPTRGF